MNESSAILPILRRYFGNLRFANNYSKYKMPLMVPVPNSAKFPFSLFTKDPAYLPGVREEVVM